MPSKKRNYRKEYDNYHGTAKQKKNRAARNCTRAIMVKAGKAKNLRVVAKGTNRSFARTKTARMKKTRNA